MLTATISWPEDAKQINTSYVKTCNAKRGPTAPRMRPLHV
jgi:hypothetical protein